ncbi:MAG: hypothetical protein QG567_932 [Campylobacterota bacterium]|nr:hypothetical protein [Campylobacterota bacterium]
MQKNKKNLKIEMPVDIYSLEKHLYSLMFSGVYVSNIDIRNVMKNMGYDVPMDSREALFEKLFLRAEKENKKEQAYKEIMVLLKKKVEKYEDLKNSYPQSSKPISDWINKAENTIFRMKDEIVRMGNVSK